MLSIPNPHVSVGDKPILKGLTPGVPAGAAHAVVGPDGAVILASCYDPGRRMP